jgi:hypothetical protein
MKGQLWCLIFFDEHNELLDAEGVGDMFPSMAVLGNASLKLSGAAGAGGDDEHFAFGLGGSGDPTVAFIYLREKLKLVINSHICSSCRVGVVGG